MSRESESRAQRFDLGYVMMLGLIVAVSCWLLAMPFSRFIQDSTLHRFHLTTRHFALWSMQQPIPAMYNFYNRFEVSPSPWKKSEPSSVHAETLNHFPLRIITFGDNRQLFLPADEPRQIDIWSRYRGNELRTRYLATPLAEGGFQLELKPIP